MELEELSEILRKFIVWFQAHKFDMYVQYCKNKEESNTSKIVAILKLDKFLFSNLYTKLFKWVKKLNVLKHLSTSVVFQHAGNFFDRVQSANSLDHPIAAYLIKPVQVTKLKLEVFFSPNASRPTKIILIRLLFKLNILHRLRFA